MKVSVIIPARDAADTIAETFHSLTAQTFSDWEAIVIDDGSTDDTAAIARRQAERDPRFRVITGDAAGVGAARNKGLEQARSDWILFLDADDWIVPTHLEKLTESTRQDPELSGAACRYARVSENGTVIDVGRWWQPDRLFEEFARTCPWTVHSCIVRKDLVFEVGGFLPGWKTCEDWDLWQRVTRTGARFALVDEPLALYRMRPGSASLDAVDMVRGAIATINRGHGPDPRVPNPKPEFANGAPPEGAARARLFAVIWSAALVLGEGRDACDVLVPVAGERDPGLDPTVVGYSVYLGALLPGAHSADAWVDLLPLHSENIDRFLRRVEEITGAPYRARRARNYLEYLAMNAAPAEARGRLGRTGMATVEATEPIRDVAAEPGVERIAFGVTMEGHKIGSVYLPVV
ncbi:glycosyltransferase, partial [bacterium]|nr:glycosyltransferase [bacterium]